MLPSFLNKARGGVSVGIALAFFYGQMSAETRLVPGAFLAQQPPQSAPVQPGQVQPPPVAPADGQTTVVQVPVPKENTLDITVVEGEGASNTVGKKISARPLVEVRDEKNQLLEGAVVTFLAPADGPSVVFSNGLRTVTVITDSAGRARTPSFRAVNDGPFRLQVSASFRGQTVSTSISQTNSDTANGKSSADHPAANKKSGGGGLSGTAWALILGAGAAAAVGIGVGLSHKGSTTATTTSATIGGPGTPTVGAP